MFSRRERGHKLENADFIFLMPILEFFICKRERVDFYLKQDLKITEKIYRQA